MSRHVHFDAAHYPARDRVDSWLDALAAVCGRLDAAALAGDVLDARMTFGAIEGLRIGHIAASRHRVGLTRELARREPHDVVKVIVQTAGTSIYEQRGETVELSPGEGLIYEVGTPHTITSTSHSEHYVVIVPRALVDERGVRLHHLPSQRFTTRTGVGHLGAALIASTLAELDAITPAAEADLATSILNLALLPLVTRPGDDTLLLRAKAYIRAHAREPALSVASIAAALRCSKRTLHAAFASCDHSLAELIRITRLDGSKAELVAHPERTVTEVAFAWGFASAAHFSRLFHQRFGITPSCARRQVPPRA